MMVGVGVVEVQWGWAVLVRSGDGTEDGFSKHRGSSTIYNTSRSLKSSEFRYRC